MKRVSVVINTYNRAENLKDTLRSLQYLNHQDFEVIVVNGPSTDSTEEVLNEFASTVKIGRCVNRNLSESRNIGICMATGDIVAFIDDDAIPDPEWLNCLDAGYDTDDVAAVGGPVYNHTGYELQTRYIVTNRFGDSTLDSSSNPTAYLNFPQTNIFCSLLGTNSSFRRQTLIEIGGFDEEYEYYLDETDVCLRLVDRGYVVKILDDGYVYHKFLPSDLRNERRVMKNRYSIIKNRCYFAFKHGLSTNSISDIVRDFDGFAHSHTADFRWCVENGLLTEEDYRQFQEDLIDGFNVGLTQATTGHVEGLTDAKMKQHAPAFKHYPTLLPREEKLHICYFSQEYPPGPIGGIGRATHELATGLAALGHTIHVLTRGTGHHRVDFEDGVWVHRIVPETRPLPSCLESLGIPPHIWDYSASLYAELLRIHRHKPVDLVQAPNWDAEGIAAVLGGVVPTIISIYTPLKLCIEINPDWIRDPVFRHTVIEPIIALEKLCFQRNNGVLAIGQAIVQTIEDRYDLRFNRDLLAVVPHGLADKSVGIMPRPLSSTVEVLFVGRLEKRKGIDVLLACAPSLCDAFPDVRFVIVGDDTIPGENGVPYRREFEQSVAGQCLADRIVFTGAIDEAELWQRYADCDIFVAPSRFESFGLILVEAMMFGKPVIGGNTGGMREIVENGANGYLVPPGDVEALSNAIADLAKSAERRRRFGERSRKIFEEKFSKSRMVKEVQSFYKRLLKNQVNPYERDLEIGIATMEKPLSNPNYS